MDIHNYMRYNPTDLGLDVINSDPNGSDVIGMGSQAPSQTDFGNIWNQLATQFVKNDHIMFDLMNEPHDMNSSMMIANENEAINRIRDAEQAAGAPSHWILVEGNYWSGLHSWFDAGPNGQPANNDALKQIKDVKNHYAIEVHQYLDANSSGTSANCDPSFPTNFNIYFPKFMQWSHDNKVPVFLGEFGAPNNDTCRADEKVLLDAVNSSKNAYSSQGNNGILGWTVWSAGHSWSNYLMSVAPGGPANSLMWDKTLFENYLQSVGTMPALPPIIAKLKNTLSAPLHGGGFIPFQFQGNTDIAPGGTMNLYSDNTTSTPTQQLELTYYLTDPSIVLGMGVTTDGYGYGYSNIQGVTITPDTSCSISGNKRCWTVNQQ